MKEPTFPTIHNRHSIRLKGYDYCQTGVYFVTAVSWKRECLFGEIASGRMQLNPVGNIIHYEWLNLANHFPGIQSGAFVVMPNHIHGIIIIERATRDQGAVDLNFNDSEVEALQGNLDGSPLQQVIPAINVGATRWAENSGPDSKYSMGERLTDSLAGSPKDVRIQPKGPIQNSLGAMVGQFKSRATKRIWKLPAEKGCPIWQRNYYEHIVRNASEYERIVDYIESNPLNWQEDELYPTTK